MKIQALTRANTTACARRQPNHGTAVMISSRPGAPRSGEQQVPERPSVLPAVAASKLRLLQTCEDLTPHLGDVARAQGQQEIAGA